MSDAFEIAIKGCFDATGVVPQYNTPAWKACQYIWDAAMLHAAEVVRESLVNSRYMVEVAALHECIGKLHKEVQGE